MVSLFGSWRRAKKKKVRESKNEGEGKGVRRISTYLNPMSVILLPPFGNALVISNNVKQQLDCVPGCFLPT